MHPLRPFTESDRPAVEAMGAEIIDAWDQHVALHVVAGDPIVGHLQAVDRGTTPHRRLGSIEMRLTVAPDHRRQGIGTRLYERVLAFAGERQADSIRASYMERSPAEPAHFFLKHHRFVELQRYQPSRLNVSICDLSPFEGLEPRLAAEGVRFLTYTDVPDTDENRRRLFALDQAARSDLPYPGDPEPSEPEPFEQSWVAKMQPEQFSTVELAAIENRWVGLSTSGVSWGFTGVVPAYRRRGIATALKVRAIRSAKERGVQTLETENRADNLGMLAINCRLGYQFGPPEVECIRRLR
jgi:GNAT superfamily N-acetyltransferase